MKKLLVVLSTAFFVSLSPLDLKKVKQDLSINRDCWHRLNFRLHLHACNFKEVAGTIDDGLRIKERR